MKLKRIFLFIIPFLLLALTACEVETEERAYTDEDAERVTTIMVDMWNTGNTDLADSIYTDKSVRNQVGTRMFNGPAEIKELVDFLIDIPSKETPRIQESHIMVGHIVCDLVERTIFGDQKWESKQPLLTETEL